MMILVVFFIRNSQRDHHGQIAKQRQNTISGPVFVSKSQIVSDLMNRTTQWVINSPTDKICQHKPSNPTWLIDRNHGGHE